jgi:hypothetical protein
MGMDIYGINPSTPVGKYFRCSISGWPSLWDYCCSVSSLAREVKEAYFNEGDGLDALGATSLAKTLQDELDNGRTSQYIAQREKTLEELPDEPCRGCTDGPNHGPAFGEDVFWKFSSTPNNGAGTCDVCKGTGKVRPFATRYYLDEGGVRKFAEFLKHCGGFAIW